MSTGNRRGRLPSPPISYDARWANQLINQLEMNLSNTNLAASSATYTMTNVTADRVLDADSTTLAEVADVLGTLINDLRDRGVIG
tara:strand:- start:6367 stop:6621 length:255 start_codon:yes stop_codon:yes gene_type:complete